MSSPINQIFKSNYKLLGKRRKQQGYGVKAGSLNTYKKYYRDKELAVNRIAVENIRETKRKELENDRQTRLRELARRRQMAPSLNLKQIAYVEFI